MTWLRRFDRKMCAWLDRREERRIYAWLGKAER